MAFSLSQIFRSRPPPPEDVALAIMEKLTIEQPSTLSDETAIPCLRGDDPLFGFYDRSCDIRKHFKNIVLRAAPRVDDVVLIDVIGCVNSKSPSTSFAEMAQIPWLAKKTNELRFKNDLSDFFDAVFNGSHDCVSRKDENPRVFRQDWDGKMWFANNGGSHRTTTLWELDRLNQYRRSIACDVVDFSISPDAKKIAEKNSIFIFHLEERTSLRDQRDLFKSLDILVDCDENPAFADNDRPNCCIIISKTHALYERISHHLSNARDFSDWILNPANQRELSPELQQRQPALA